MDTNRGMRFIAEKGYAWNNSICLFIFGPSAGMNGMEYVSDLIITHTEDNFIEKETPINLSPTQAQELMDSLWDCGLRPSEGSGSAGALLATQEHLKDIKVLADRLMVLVEKRWTK